MKKFSGITFVLTLVVTIFIGCGNKNSKASDSSETQAATSASEQPLEAVATLQSRSELTTNAFKLQGKLVDKPGVLVYLNELTTQKLVQIDTARTDENGEFEFRTESEDLKIGYITINSAQPPGVPIVMQNGQKLKIEISGEPYFETKVKGDKHNAQLKKLYDLYMQQNIAGSEFQQEINSLDPRSISDSTRRAVTLQFEKMQNDNEKEVWAFIKNEPTTAATYFAATYIVQKPQMSMLDDALTKLEKDMPEAKLTKELASRVRSVRPLEIGGEAPDIALENPEGKIVKLSSLRGNVVLIDFWASWCRPCRMENPNVKRMYDKYHKKGFDIYGVSLDKDAAKWKGAIAQDGLTWYHVSDLKGWSSSAAALYKVNSIPKTFLLDKKGRIIATDLRGPALERKLEELFK